LENSTVTLLINYFDIISTTVLAFFAIYGVIAVFGRKSSLNVFRRNIFMQAFCVAALFAFALEVSLFNFPHYLKYFSDEEFHTLGISPQDSTVILTSNGTAAELFFEKSNDTPRDSSAVSVSDSVSTETSSEENDSETILSGFLTRRRV
jgi:hypothetical protein